MCTNHVYFCRVFLDHVNTEDSPVKESGFNKIDPAMSCSECKKMLALDEIKLSQGCRPF